MQVIPVSTYSLKEGNQVTTATFLAAQKAEEARNAPWTASPANDCLGVGPTVAPTVPAGGSCTNGTLTIPSGGVTFAEEAPVTGSPDYSRNVRVTACTAGCAGITDASVRMVTVNVTYRPLTANGVSATTKTLSLTVLKTQR
jgi:hypothetical protein